ncbi:hypothetical protein LCGC14_2402980, partial [marine sediment metagenome]
ATWSVVAPTLKKVISPSPVVATWNAVGVLFGTVVKPDPVSIARWKVIKPSLNIASMAVGHWFIPDRNKPHLMTGGNKAHFNPNKNRAHFSIGD